MKNTLFIVMALCGLAAMGAPFALPAIGGAASTLLVGFGVLLTILAMVLLVIVNVYVKTKANEAFVRTGAGGRRVIMDGGALVIPVVHEMIVISLETLKLDVQRFGKEALITKDNLRCDIGAEFFVKVEPEAESVIKAAQSLGERMAHAEAVKGVVEDKLISALRSVAATKELAELHSQREVFVKEVTQNVNEDLKQNGLTLETVTISRLDQTSVEFLKEDNIFDSRGRRTIAEITEKQKTERNQLVRAGERARTEEDVNTRKTVLALDQQQKEAEAAQAAAVSAARSASEREAQEKDIEAKQAVHLANVEMAKQVKLAQVEQEKTAQVATVEQQQAIQLAGEIQKRQVDLAAAQREQAVAEANKVKALEEAELQKALAKRQAEQEAIVMVQVQQSAERDKTAQVVKASAQAEAAYLTQQRTADAKAYQIKVDAEARKTAADADAEAKIKAANADKTAALAKVESDQAAQLIPVNVQQAQVNVEQARVEVEKSRLETVTIPDLKAREEHGKVAQDFELAKFSIEQEAHVRIETAKATASIVGKIEGTFFGTPEQVKNMTDAYMLGNIGNEALKALGSNKTVAQVVGELASKVLPSADND